MFCRIESSKRMRRGPRSLTCPSNPLTNVHPSFAVDELLHIRHKVCTPGNPFMKERFMVIVMKERTGGKANENVSKRVILGNVRAYQTLFGRMSFRTYTYIICILRSYSSSDTYWRVCFEDHDSTGHFRL